MVLEAKEEGFSRETCTLRISILYRLINLPF